MLIGSLRRLIVLTTQPSKLGLDLADALIYSPLISSVHDFGDYLVQAGGELSKIAGQVLTQLRDSTVQLLEVGSALGGTAIRNNSQQPPHRLDSTALKMD